MEMNETNIYNLRVALGNFEAKIEELKKLDENISCEVETEKEVETDIAEAGRRRKFRNRRQSVASLMVSRIINGRWHYCLHLKPICRIKLIDFSF